MKKYKIIQLLVILLSSDIVLGQAAGLTTTSPVYITTSPLTINEVLIGRGGSATGSNCIALGTGALGVTSTSTYNIAIGPSALSVLNSGAGANIAVGYFALQSTTTGFNNCAVGITALKRLTTGKENSAFGYAALMSYHAGATGNQNAAFGANALERLTTGGNNSAFGYYGMNIFLTGDGNTSVGGSAMKVLTSGSSNVAVGQSAMAHLTTGDNNVGIGTITDIPDFNGTSGPGSNQLTIQNVIYGKNMTGTTSAGTGNIGICVKPAITTSGKYAKLHIGGSSATSMPSLQLDYAPVTLTTPVNNPNGNQGMYLFMDEEGIVGQAPLPTAVSLSNEWHITGNTGITNANFIGTDGAPFNIRVGTGQRAGRIDATSGNSFYGSLSGDNSATGIENTAIGHKALTSVSSANDNLAVGAFALATNSTGDQNVAVGNYALNLNNGGTENTALGYLALTSDNTGSKNTAVGSRALHDNDGSDDNTAIGFSALSTNVTGQENTALGSFADVSATYLSNATAIGSSAVVNTSNTIQLGATSVTDVVAGDAISAAPSSVTTVTTGQLRVTNTPTVGWVLTCWDISGLAKWQPAGCICREELSQEIDHQNKIIEDLKKQVAELKAIMNSNASTQGTFKVTQTSDAKLFQNAPNPFTKSTMIRYSIPATAKKAVLTITSISGVKIKEYDLKNKNAQSVEISERELSAGTYVYSLIVDDSFVDAKQMILTR